MEEERGIREIRFDPSDLWWNTAEEALQRLNGLAQLASVGARHRGKPLPKKHETEILGSLVQHLFPDGTTAELETTVSLLDPRQKEYLTELVFLSRAELEQIVQSEPSKLLGFPPDTRAMWSNLLGRSWIPFPSNWKGVVR